MRADCHVHLDPIGRPHRTPPPSPYEFACYARRESIKLFGAIFEHELTLSQFTLPGIELFPFFWERKPSQPSIPRCARGVKLHPYIDGYRLSLDAVGAALEVAKDRGLVVLIHTDDRTPDVSRGRHFAPLARQFRSVPLVVAHSGSYSPGILDRPGASYTDEALMTELVTEAIEAATEHENLFLEVSVLASRAKASLIAKTAPREKILLGSDFPIRKDVFGSVVFQEDALRLEGLNCDDIVSLHRNATQILT